MSTPEELRYRDGNALSGVFAEVLGVDVSTTVLTCTGCGGSGPFARGHVYDDGPGAVLRCPDCNEILVRIVRTPTDLWLDLRGSTSWRIPAQT
jgi:hypothetical protein